MAHTVMEGISPKIYSKECWRPRRAHDVIQSERMLKTGRANVFI